MPRSLLILGRQPELGLAELESLYGAEHLKPFVSSALLDIEASEVNFKRLGGTIKVAKILNFLPTSKWTHLENYLLENIPQHLRYLPDGQFTLGLSVYGLEVTPRTIHSSTMKIKKQIRQSGRSVRIVPNNVAALSSAQVLHNRLTHRGSWELLIVSSEKETYLAQTMFVQDIEAYAARDQKRPKRDARIGMLPPKLAQIIVNLTNAPIGSTILDPFCGTGVILQEALLSGYNVIGSDIDKRMVEYSVQNINWLTNSHADIKNKSKIREADATKEKWSGEFSSIASELYLGRPLKSLPHEPELDKIIDEVSTIITLFLKNIFNQIKSGTVLSLAVPAWQTPNGNLIKLPVIDQLTDMGYNYLDFKHVKSNNIVYHRENQIVARQLLVIRKK